MTFTKVELTLEISVKNMYLKKIHTAKRNKKPLVYGTADRTSPY